MLTKEEIGALVQIINRITLTQAEMLWINSVIAKLMQPESSTN